jgi:YegS/Rv2252/BmrU family lipid kinase
MARALLIFNPAAARTEPAVVQSVCTVFTGAGWKVEVTAISRPGQAGDLAREGVSAGADVIVVYGGDGTTMQVVRGMIGLGVPVGLIPGGTGNVLAGNLRLPRNPEAAARTVVRGIPRSVDVGRVERDDGTHYFAVASGAGLDAELMTRTTGTAKRRWGLGAYVARTVEALGDLRVVGYRITVDGELIERDGVMLLVANCRELIPPFFPLGSGIALDDGVFDVVVINAANALQGAGVVWRLVTGSGRSSGRIRYARGRRITVETEVPLPVQLDGEAGGVTPFTAEVVPGALNVIVDRG